MAGGSISKDEQRKCGELIPIRDVSLNLAGIRMG